MRSLRRWADPCRRHRSAHGRTPQPPSVPGPRAHWTLKGLPDPVECVEVLWEPLSGGGPGATIPPPRSLARPPGFRCDRPGDRDCRSSADAVKAIAAGEAHRALLISGEAGLRARPPWWPRHPVPPSTADPACCSDIVSRTWRPHISSLSKRSDTTSRTPPRSSSSRTSPRTAPNWLGWLPSLASRIPDLPPSKATDADTERYLLFAAVVGLLAQVSQHQPVVLVLDDLQWADKASLQLLRHIMAADQPMRVLILGTYRDSELSQSHPLLRDAWPPYAANDGVARSSWPGSTNRRGVLYGGHRRLHPR